MSTGSDYTTLDLRRMDRETARNTLTVAEFERWEAVQELREQAEETRDQWEAEEQKVSEITVAADMDSLGTTVDVFGNDLLVHVDPEDDDIRAAAELIDAEFGDDLDVGDVEDLDTDALDRLGDVLMEFLDAVIVRWDGTEFSALDAEVREQVLSDARGKWGVQGLALALVDIMSAVEEDRTERMDMVESFRGEKGRGNSPATRHDGMPDPQ